MKHHGISLKAKKRVFTWMWLFVAFLIIKLVGYGTALSNGGGHDGLFIPY